MTPHIATRRNLLAGVAAAIVATPAVPAAGSAYAADVASVQAIADHMRHLEAVCDQCRADFEGGADQDCEAWTIASDEYLRAQVSFTRARNELHAKVLKDAGIPTF